MAPSNYSSSLSALILQIQRNPKRSAATKQAAAAPKVLPAGVSSKPADVPKLSTASPGAAGIRRSLKTTQPAHPVKGQEPGNPPTIFQLAVQQRLKRELDKGTAPRNGNGRLHSYMGRLKPVPDSECPSAEAVEQIVLPAALPEEIVEAATEELPVTAAEPEAVSEAAASNEAEATEENETAETGFEFELVAEEVERCLDEAICKGVLHKTLNTWGSSDYTGLRRMEPDRGVRIGKLRLERPDEKECPNGRKVKTAGIVLIRQRPSTASGVVFMTIEDETGTANLVVFPQVFQKYRAALSESVFIYVEGRLQREEELVHVILERAKPLGFDYGEMASMSRDFH